MSLSRATCGLSERRPQWTTADSLWIQLSAACRWPLAKVGSGTKKLTNQGWITKVQMAGPQYAGSPEHAEIYSTILEEKDHHHKAFRDKDIKLYYWSQDIIQKYDNKDETTEVSADAPMSAEAFEQVRKAMLDTNVGNSTPALENGETTGKKRGGKRQQKTPEEKELEQQKKKDQDAKLSKDQLRRRTAVEELDTVLKGAKAWCKDGGSSKVNHRPPPHPSPHPYFPSSLFSSPPPPHLSCRPRIPIHLRLRCEANATIQMALEPRDFHRL